MTNRKIDDIQKDEQPASVGTEQPQIAFCRAVGYVIRVKDHLDTYWYAWFEGWSITNIENGEVLLKRDRVDQSMLHGTLQKIRDLNLTLLSVTCISANE